MKIGIIGPSKMDYLLEINNDAERIISNIAKKLKSHEIYLTPDKGSVSEFFALEYKKVSDNPIKVVVPLDDKEFGSGWVNTKLGETINCGTWRNQPESLNELTDALVCLGYSVGGLAEIAYSKWFNPKPIYIINELISGKLPKEIERSLDLRYLSYEEMGKEI